MISYNDFILESKIQLLLESQIGFSSNFSNVLRNIKTPLASEIIKLQNKDIDVQYNYIDISDENDSVTFTPDRKAKEIIGNKEILWKVIEENRYLTNALKNKHIYVSLDFEIPSEVYQPDKDTIGKVLGETVSATSGKVYCLFECTEGSDTGNKTIINKEALQEVDGSLQKIWTANRNKIKIGRFIRALIRVAKISATDSEIEKFVNQYKSTIDIMNDAFNRFDIVSGEKLVHFYNIENYSNKNNGTLANSCMADVPETYLHIYKSNPDVCKLVILYDDSGKILDNKYTSDKIIGRAILWKTREDDMFMDRIYTNRDSDVDLFKKFAEKNNWWYKSSQQSNYNFNVIKGQENKRPLYIVDLQKWDDEFPYLDSLQFFNNSTGELSNSRSEINANCQLDDTNGGYETLYTDDDE